MSDVQLPFPSEVALIGLKEMINSSFTVLEKGKYANALKWHFLTTHTVNWIKTCSCAYVVLGMGARDQKF